MTRRKLKKKTQRRLAKPKGGHKWCPLHKKTYLLIPDLAHHQQTGACAHPDCVDKQITNLCAWKKKPTSISRIWSWILKKDLREEFRSYLMMRLLREVYEFDRPAIINYTTLRFTMLKFINEVLPKGYYSKNNDNEASEEEEWGPGSISRELQSMIFFLEHKETDPYGVGQPIDPEESYAVMEVRQELVRLFGEEIVAAFMKDISLFEASKILGISITKIKEKIQECREEALLLWEGE